MQERLIEHWLDSINERGYQSAFLQMLAGEGYTVVHSTRHTAIEFGKDVVAIGPDGVPCAFQLKGNPGSRLNLTQFREIKGQIDQLVEQPIVFPGMPEMPHRCYLVTNGEIEEEVQRTVDDLNRGYERRGLPSDTRLHLISRGVLLDWATKHSTAFWTENFSIQDKLIRLYNENGADAIPLDLLTDGLDEILKLTASDVKLTVADIERRQISASLFVAFAVRAYQKANNQIAVAAAYAALFAALECSVTRHAVKQSARNRNAVSIAREGFLSAALDFASELGAGIREIKVQRGDTEDIDYNVLFLGGGTLSSHLVWRARALIASAMLSVINIEARQAKSIDWLTEDAQRAIEIFTKPGYAQIQIWGEGAIPQALAVIWNWHLTNPTMLANYAEGQLLEAVVTEILSDAKGYMATPYHSDEDALRDHIGRRLGIDRGKVEAETMRHSSFFVEALFDCFVRSNLKSSAKMLWPKITKITHQRFLHENSWEYCLWKIEKGDSQTAILPRRKTWTEVQAEAADVSTPLIPPGLRNDPVMLLAFTIFFPHRAFPQVIRFLHFAICGVWFLPFPLPTADRP